MELEPTPSLVFKVWRKDPELVAPAKPTPRELKPLSDLDDPVVVRRHIPILMMYRNNPSVEGKDPVKVIREAIAQTLVCYYPLAGRLREGPGRKLSVDCTGEGVMFIEADADVTLDDFGVMLHPPFPCVEELLFDVPGSAGILHCPLLLIQATRLKCGGFVFAVRLNHTMIDAPGIVQFMSTVGEMARGALSPSNPPSWNREFFRARDPPRVTHTYFDGVVILRPVVDQVMVEKSFFFGPSQVSALRRLVPRNLSHCSTFDILTACLWRCRAVALQFDPKDEVHVMFVFNTRRLKFDPPMPRGYYGNAASQVVASTTAESLCDASSFGCALELIRKAKADVTEEYVRSIVDLTVIKGFVPVPGMTPGGQCLAVSDLRLAGFADVDFGWGRAVYGGPALSSTRANRGLATAYVACKSHEGEEGTVVQMAFPRAAMKIFETELDSMLNHKRGNYRSVHPLKPHSRIGIPNLIFLFSVPQV